jgi:YD repeat-containing protein
LGNITKTTDPIGNVTVSAHDNLGRKISETNAEGGVTKFTFDATGRMSSLTDPVGNKTTWTRNIIGQVSRETVVIDNISRVRYFDYDASGNIIAKYDRNKRVTEWTFDKLNRHTSEIWYDSAQSWRAKKPYKKFTTTYNRKGKIETIQDNDNKFTFDYGVFGNEIKQVQNITGFNKPIEQNFVTDINGLKRMFRFKLL